MDYISIYTDRRTWREMANPTATTTAGELVKALSDLPEELPVFFENGGYLYALDNPPVKQARKD